MNQNVSHLLGESTSNQITEYLVLLYLKKMDTNVIQIDSRNEKQPDEYKQTVVTGNIKMNTNRQS